MLKTIYPYYYKNYNYCEYEIMVWHNNKTRYLIELKLYYLIIKNAVNVIWEST